MKHNVKISSLSLFLFLSLITLNIFGQQTGKIAGKVTDKKSGETLIGVSVKIVGTTTGASTDVEGKFILGNLNSGNYAVAFSYVGYATKNITDVEIVDGKVTNLDVVMDESSGQQLKEVVVTASAKRESLTSLYAQQKSSINISSGISSDLIRKSPDKNTSEVLRRVSGASIQDNKFVIIRGLSDRYNSSMLNNSILPNTEPDRKAFSFDILPSNLIDNIVVKKTASADIPADFSGGVVQISTKDFPESKLFNVSLGTSYNTQSSFKNFLSPSKNGNEAFGFYNKDRDIPTTFPDRSNYEKLSLDQKVALSKQFTNNWGYNKVNSAIGPNFQVNYGTSKIYSNNNKLGTVLSLSYRYDERLRTSDQKDYNGQSLGDIFHDNVYSYNANIGGLANFAYAWGNNKISLKNLYNRIVESSFTNRNGIDDGGSAFIRTADYLLQRSLISNQLTGDHLLSETSKIKLDWNLNYANTNGKEPGFKKMEYSNDGIASVPSSGSASTKIAGNFSSLLSENSYGGAANLLIPIKRLGDKSKIKLGYFGQYRLRDFSARVLGFVTSPGFDGSGNLLKLSQDQIFSPTNISNNGFLINEITNGTDKYDANSILNAGYAMFDGYLTSKLRIGIGARVEAYHQKLNSSNNSFEPLNVDENVVNLLPSTNLIYNLTEKASIRMSASQTVGRPEFRELAPFSFYDFKRNAYVQGNPFLKQSRTSNADLGYAFYPSPGEVLSVSAFYKKFTSPIEQGQITGVSGKAYTYNNAKSASLYGIELELRKSLSFISERYKNISFSTNASYINSRVNVPKTVNKDGYRPMQGQSPYLVNAGLQYNSSKPNSTGLSLLYNRIGQRIWSVGNIESPDIYENSRNILDLQISQKFAKSRAEIKLNYSDILNNKAIYYQNVSGTKGNTIGYDGSEIDRLNFSDRLGSTISLGLTYKIR